MEGIAGRSRSQEVMKSRRAEWMEDSVFLFPRFFTSDLPNLTNNPTEDEQRVYGGSADRRLVKGGRK
jgi:hypothetical protein